mmetsp:Transcript_7015/g.10760  ORF Transcript_7015/g.10760 Transcript_7015/m.10760 type:complete len:94 (+) Transcript_7015:966-1247(+)
MPQRAEHLSQICEPQFRQWKFRHLALKSLLQHTQLLVFVIILGGEYALANFRASLSVKNGKLTQRRLSSELLLVESPSKGRANVAIHFDVARL